MNRPFTNTGNSVLTVHVPELRQLLPGDTVTDVDEKIATPIVARRKDIAWAETVSKAASKDTVAEEPVEDVPAATESPAATDEKVDAPPVEAEKTTARTTTRKRATTPRKTKNND